MGVLEDLLDEVRTLRQEVGALNEARPEPSSLLDAQGAADLLCLSKQSIEMMGKRGQIPSLVLPNRRRRYERDALLEWAKERE